MAIHNEAVLESEICADLAARGWLYTPPMVAALALMTPSTIENMPSLPAGSFRLDRSHPAQSLAGTAKAAWRSSHLCFTGAPAGLPRQTRHPAGPPARHRTTGLTPPPIPSAVSPGHGTECRTAGTLRRQPAAGHSSDALLPEPSELHRPGAVPERPAGGHGGDQDRLHPIH